jgi:O-antigen/teichoic acid export membrane protein
MLGLYRALMNGLFLAGALCLVRTGEDVLWVPILDAGASVLALFLCVAIRPGILRLLTARPEPGKWPGLVKEGLPFGAANLLALAVPHVGVFVLAASRGAGDAGVFKAAGVIVFGLASIGVLIARAAYPVMSKAASGTSGSPGDVVHPVFALALTLSLPAALGCSILAGPIVALIYSDDFAISAGVLSVLVWSLPMALTAATCQYALLAVGKPGKRLVGLAVHMGVELAMALVLVPRSGVWGAAFAHLAGQAAGIAYLYSSLRRAGHTGMFRHAIGPAAACLILLAVVLPLRRMHVAVPVAAGAAAYFAALLFLRSLRSGEHRPPVSRGATAEVSEQDDGRQEASVRGRGPLS